MNQNELAKEIARLEGKKVSINIAQIKEIMRIHNHLLNKHFTSEEVLKLVDRYGKFQRKVQKRA